MILCMLTKYMTDVLIFYFYFIFKLNIYLEYEKKWQQITSVLKLQDKKKNMGGVSPFPTLPCTGAGYCTPHPLKRFKLEHKKPVTV